MLSPLLRSFAAALACALLGLTCVGAPPAYDEAQRFALPNGVVVLLESDATAELAVVMLGVRAGVLDEPEGRNGLAHLSEHLFLHGGTESAPAGEAFAKLVEGGVSGQPFADVNAETLPELTYFYALRRPNDVSLPLRLFAEKLGGVAFDAGLLEVERAKALGEIEGVERMLEGQPALRAQMERLARRPKAGTRAELAAVKAEEIQAFLAGGYRPDRCVLLVAGAFDVAAARKEIEARFGALRARVADPLTDVAERASDGGVLWRAPHGALASTEPALGALLAVVWQQSLRRLEPRAFVELAPSGALRAWIAGDDAERLTTTRHALRLPLGSKDWSRAQRDAGAEARQWKSFAAQPLPQLPRREQQLLAYAQRAIYRLRFEIAGGESLLERLASLRPEQLAELVLALP